MFFIVRTVFGFHRATSYYLNACSIVHTSVPGDAKALVDISDGILGWSLGCLFIAEVCSGLARPVFLALELHQLDFPPHHCVPRHMCATAPCK
jgi:hypothetical protein